MQVIKLGTRGASVEDIQRRLISLGYSLGATGVDGVFLEDTRQAVMDFQKDNNLELSGEVDARTWSALVDSTFAFGDRVLYLRYPYFHGNDVFMLQRALNSLGFNCGILDGIFGPFTERAVRDFQANLDADSDGVVGASTFTALQGMKHIWDTRESKLHSASNAASLKREDIIVRYCWRITFDGPASRQVATRVQNLMRASSPQAEILVDESSVSAGHTPLVELNFTVMDGAQVNSSVVNYVADRKALASRFAEVFQSQGPDYYQCDIFLQDSELIRTDKLHNQFIAAVILDSVCMAFK